MIEFLVWWASSYLIASYFAAAGVIVQSARIAAQSEGTLPEPEALVVFWLLAPITMPLLVANSIRGNQ